MVSQTGSGHYDEGIDPINLLADLGDLIDSLDPADFSKTHEQNTLGEKIDAILNDLDLNDVVTICDAIDKLANDLLPKTDGLSPP